MTTEQRKLKRAAKENWRAFAKSGVSSREAATAMGCSVPYAERLLESLRKPKIGFEVRGEDYQALKLAAKECHMKAVRVNGRDLPDYLIHEGCIPPPQTYIVPPLQEHLYK